MVRQSMCYIVKMAHDMRMSTLKVSNIDKFDERTVQGAE